MVLDIAKPRHITRASASRGMSNIQSADIYELTKGISKFSEELPFPQSYGWHLDFCSACIDHIERKGFKLDTKDKFDIESDSITSLLKYLLDTLFENEQVVWVDVDGAIFFLERIDSMQQYFCFDLSWMLKVRPEPLKVGLAHLAKKLETTLDVMLDRTLFNSEDIVDAYPYQLDYYIEEGDCSDSPKKMRRREVQSFLNKGKKLINLLDKYYAMDIETFYNYRPRSKQHKKVHRAIFNMLNCDPISVKCLMDFEDVDMGGMSFRHFYNLHIDTENQFDMRVIEDNCNDANNCGFSAPARWVKYEGSKFQEEITDTEVQAFHDYERTFDDLAIIFNKL